MQKKIILVIFVISFVILTFGKSYSEISFYFIFGNKVESGISTDINYCYSLEEWAFLKIKSNFYPINIKINDQNLILLSNEQVIIVKPKKIKISYKNHTFEYLAKKGYNVISLVKNIQLKPDITFLEFRDEVSPNGDWNKDKMKLVLNSNTYAKLKLDINKKTFEKEIFPGNNQLYFDFKNIDDGEYKVYVNIYNEMGSVKEEKTVLIDKTKKFYSKEFLFVFIGFFASIIMLFSS